MAVFVFVTVNNTGNMNPLICVGMKQRKNNSKLKIDPGTGTCTAILSELLTFRKERIFSFNGKR